MPTNKVQVDAAKRYAKSHGITTHEAMESHNFKFAWNQFLKHPTDETFRGALGIRRRKLSKEAEAEDREYANMRKFGDTP